RPLQRAARLVEPHDAGRRAGHVHEPEGGRDGRQDRGVRRGLADRERGISRAARGHRATAGQLDTGVRRFRRRDLSHLVRGPVRLWAMRCGWGRLGAAWLVLMTAVTTPMAAGAAGDVAAGRRKALQCQTCHGLDGLSKLPEAPHLAGQPEPYLVKSLNDYRSGVRKHDMITLVVPPLTDQCVADRAAFSPGIR